MLSNLPKLYQNFKVPLVSITAYNYSPGIGALNSLNLKQNIKLAWLNSKIIYSMSIIRKDVPIQKMIKKNVEVTRLQTLFNYLNSIKQSSEEEIKKKFDRIVKEILSCPLSPSERTSAIKYFMSILYRKQFSSEELRKNQYLTKLYKDQEFIELQTYIYLISREMSKDKPDSQAINALYLEAFERIVKQMPNGYQKIKCESLLFKNFGKYMVQHGYFQKGVEMLEKSIFQHKQLVSQQYEKMQNFIKKCTQESKRTDCTKTKQQKEHQRLQNSAMKQNIRRLIQSMFQTINYYYFTKKSSIKPGISNIKQKQEIMLDVCNVISQCMKVKTFVPGIQLYSRHFHKLMQINYELQYAYALSKNNVERVKELRSKMRDFIKECMNDLQETSEQIEVQREIALVILTIQLHLSKTERRKDVNELRKELTDWGLKIIEKGKMEENIKSKQIITKVLSQFIKKNIS